MQIDAPFQAHSATSKEAAAKTKTTYLKWYILKFITSQNMVGATCDEIAVALGLEIHIVAARLRGLQLDGMIRKSFDRRKTRTDSPANVWKLPEFVPMQADTKRDKAKEAYNMVNHRIRTLGITTSGEWKFLNDIAGVLK